MVTILVIKKKKIYKEQTTKNSPQNEHIIDLASKELLTSIDDTIKDFTFAIESNFSSLQNSFKSIGFLKLIINNFLTWLKIQYGTLQLQYKTCDIMEIVNQSSEWIKHEAQRKGVAFEIINKLPNEVNSLCNTDGDRVKQVLLNLLRIALKFTLKGYKLTLFYMHREIIYRFSL